MADKINRPADQPTASNRDAGVNIAPTSSRVRNGTAPSDHSAQEAWIGTDDPHVSSRNVSWGAIIAGAVTFIALMVLLGIGAAALGLQDSSATVLGIWTLVGLVIAFLVAGYIAGALGVRSGLLHGFLTWATSMLAVIFLAGWLSTSVLGAFGSIAGTVATTASEAVNITSEDAQGAAEGTTQEDMDQAQAEAEATADQLADEATQTVEDIAPEAAEGSWWTFGGLLVGAVLASLAGVAGSRSVINKREQVVAGPNRL
ncbi:hypothetical protein CFAEC_00035 [Corynebacterium faecale]|uniref:TIGR04086 family membrane protein n=1 Tax=Corynebacterium faecale TaxID=1758466 RepID=UPI0025B46A10|nr:TIGR04086 family membrane protein [Corynebacterium faecale]WJY90878.1 hypothetical protein CFAEC_00035 [Corynebacterium faecale]